MKIIDYEENKMIPLTKKEKKYNKKQETCHICEEKFCASYDTHFIINQLAEEFKGKLNCIDENVEKYTTFSVPIKKDGDNDKNNCIQTKVY